MKTRQEKVNYLINEYTSLSKGLKKLINSSKKPIKTNKSKANK